VESTIIVRRRSPREWPLTGKFRGDGDRLEIAGPRPSSLAASCLIVDGRGTTLTSRSADKNRTFNRDELATFNY
jgi:hypothetical protein